MTQLAICDIQDDADFDDGETVLHGLLTKDVDISTKSEKFHAILSTENLEAITQKVKFIGTSTHPEWEVRGRWEGGKILVSCPCAIEGKTLRHDEAFRRILGQVIRNRGKAY